MAASAGTVTLNLDANSVKLMRELNKAQTSTKRSATRMRRDMQNSFKAMGRAAAGFTVAIAAASKVSIDFADKIGKTADKIGFGVEALQEYRFAAKRAGLEQRTVDMALQRFTRRAGEAANGTGEAKAALAELGIQLRDNEGNIRASEDLLMDVADAMQQVKSPADRLRLSFKLFDAEGAGMVNMLRDGSEGLGDLRKQARDLGVVMDEKLVRNAEDAADKLEDLNQILKINIATEVTENAESIIALTNALIGFVGVVGKATRGWNDWLAGQGVGINSVDDVRERGQKLLRDRLELERELSELESRRGLRKVYASSRISQLKAQIEEIKTEQLALQELAKTMQGESPRSGGSAAKTGTGGLGGVVTDSDPKAYKGPGWLMATTEMKQNMDFINAELERRNDLEGEYQSLLDQTRTPVENHVAAINRLTFLYDQDVIPSAEEYMDLVRRTQEAFNETQEKTAAATGEMDQFAVQAARNIQSAFADFLFDPFDDGLRGMLSNFAKIMQRMAAEALAAQILKNIFGTSGGGDSSSGLASVFSNLFGGGRASGGPISAGRAYLVGERGPELIVPGASGTVIPNDQLGGGVTVHIDARETDNPARLMALVPLIQNQVEQSMKQKMTRGYL